MPEGGGARWRHRYTLVGIILCLALIGWGGWVTSIDAGLAVPDWPTTFGSLDPITTGFEDPANPSAGWWTQPAILAEHGHRLLGALLGLWAIGLLAWTLAHEQRRGVRALALGILLLVVAQGVLGGLRVVWVSLDLAVAHALGAQLFFSSIVAAALVTSAPWMRTQLAQGVPRSLQRLSLATAGALLGQILLGALLRHPGAGIHLGFTVTHIAGSIAVLGLILLLHSRLRAHNLLSQWGWSLTSVLGLQMMLGVMALLVLWYEDSVGVRSLWQVGLNSAHLMTGTILLGLSVAIAMQLWRKRT